MNIDSEDYLSVPAEVREAVDILGKILINPEVPDRKKFTLIVSILYGYCDCFPKNKFEMLDAVTEGVVLLFAEGDKVIGYKKKCLFCGEETISTTNKEEPVLCHKCLKFN